MTWEFCILLKVTPLDFFIFLFIFTKSEGSQQNRKYVAQISTSIQAKLGHSTVSPSQQEVCPRRYRCFIVLRAGPDGYGSSVSNAREGRCQKQGTASAHSDLSPLYPHLSWVQNKWWGKRPTVSLLPRWQGLEKCGWQLCQENAMTALFLEWLFL